MEIAFAEKHLRKMCENQSYASQKLGTSVAGKLQARLADLEAAVTVDDLIVGAPQKLSGELEGQIKIELSEDRVMILCANEDPLPRKKSGVINWKFVTRLKLLHVGT